jgi:hypothetical protein
VTSESSTPKAMTKINSFADLTFENYYWDVATSHLYVKLQNVLLSSKLHDDMWGFSSELSDERKVTIKASCTICIPSNYNIPPAPPLNVEDQFEVSLKACTGATSTATAKAFIIFTPKTSEMSLSLFHDKGTDITGLTVSKLGTKMTIVSSLYSPVRAVVPASPSEWTE